MSNEMRKLIVMFIVTSIVTIYIGIYVNLYIWKDGQSIAEVSLYNMTMYVSWGFAFLAAAKALTRFSIRLPLGVSALCGGAAFAYLMTVHLDNRTLWIILLGIPVGLMFGLSSASQNLGIAFQGKGPDFANYFAVAGVSGQVLSMAVPLLSAKVIDWFDYAGSFVLMLLFLTIMLVFSQRMPRVMLPKPEDPAKMSRFGKFSFREAFGQPGARWILGSLLASGIFLQFQNLFALLFTFSVTQNKMLIALLNLLYTVSSLVGLWLYRKLRGSEMTWLWSGAALLAIGFLTALLHVAPALIVSNVLTTIGMFYFNTVWSAQQFHYIQRFDRTAQVSFLVWREFTLLFTRCLLLALTMNLSKLSGIWFICIVGITMICMLSVPIMQKRALVAEAKHHDNREIALGS